MKLCLIYVSSMDDCKSLWSSSGKSPNSISILRKLCIYIYILSEMNCMHGMAIFTYLMSSMDEDLFRCLDPPFNNKEIKIIFHVTHSNIVLACIPPCQYSSRAPLGCHYLQPLKDFFSYHFPRSIYQVHSCYRQSLDSWRLI